MPIGTSDGQYFDSEFEQIVSSMAGADANGNPLDLSAETQSNFDYQNKLQGILDPTEAPFNDTPTNQEQMGSQYNRLKGIEQNLEDEQNYGSPDVNQPPEMLHNINDVLAPPKDDKNFVDKAITLGGLFMVPHLSRDALASIDSNSLRDLLRGGAGAPANSNSVLNNTPSMRYGENGIYRMLDTETGAHKGDVSVSYNQNTKDVHINMIKAGGVATDREHLNQTDPGYRARSANFYSNAIGAKDIRELAREIKRIWPEAETISGYRVSGARQATGGGAADAKMKLPEPRPTPSGRIVPLAEAQHLFGGGGSPSIRPGFGRRSDDLNM